MFEDTLVDNDEDWKEREIEIEEFEWLPQKPLSEIEKAEKFYS